VFEAKQKELEGKLMPLMQTACQGAAGAGGAGADRFPELEDPMGFLVMPVASLELVVVRRRLRPAVEVLTVASIKSTKQYEI
jgi:hypothetical protein